MQATTKNGYIPLLWMEKSIFGIEKLGWDKSRWMILSKEVF